MRPYLTVPQARHASPIQNRFDATAHPRTSLCLAPPQRLKHLHHERSVDHADWQDAEDRENVVANRPHPVGMMFAVHVAHGKSCSARQLRGMRQTSPAQLSSRHRRLLVRDRTDAGAGEALEAPALAYGLRRG